MDHPLAFSVVLDPSYASGYWNFVDCFLFSCALESSCKGRLSAIKVELELELIDIVRVWPISSMYQNFNLQFTSLLSSMASILPLILPLFGIHFLKTFVHHPLLPLLERSSKPISMQRHILFSSFLLMASLWCWPISDPGLWIWILLLCCCALQSTTQWRLSTIKVDLETYRLGSSARNDLCFMILLGPNSRSGTSRDCPCPNSRSWVWANISRLGRTSRDWAAQT